MVKEAKLSSGYTTWGIPGPVVSARPELRLSDEELGEIESAIREFGCKGHDQESLLSIIAEVRRLRRENHLLNLSRGTPSVGGPY